MKVQHTSNDSAYSLVHQNIHRSIVSLAFPAMVSYLLYTLYQLINAYWIGLLGSEALAGLSACSFVVWAFYSISDLAATGTATLVAQSIGANRQTEAKQAAGQGIVLVVILSIALLIFGLLTNGWLFELMGLAPAVIEMAASYFSILVYGLVFIFLFSVMQRILHSIGDTKTPMVILIISLIMNAMMDPFFIFGWAGFPQMGLAGAAWATVISEAAATVLCAAVLIKKRFIPTFFRQGTYQILMDRVVLIFRIGAPIALSGFLFSIIYGVLTRIISTFGTNAVAALGICHRIEGTAFFVTLGFHVAATTLVGQFIGAGMPERAQKTAWYANLYSLALIGLISLVFYFAPLPLISLFTDDPGVQRVGVSYLKTIALFELGLSLEIVMEGVFAGAGYTLPPMLIYIPLTALRIPLAWYLAITLGFGISGVWWAIGVTTGLKGLLITLMFWQGSWKRKRVFK